jgi:hypothetical protein
LLSGFCCGTDPLSFHSGQGIVDFHSSLQGTHVTADVKRCD